MSEVCSLPKGLMKFQSVRGTNDILPAEVWKWRFLEEKAHAVFSCYAFEELRTPIFESTDLFVRSVGEGTDIVEKQMFTIPEEGTAGLTLRPEATAPVVRAYLEHGLYQDDRLQKLYYIGPMFRRERPQKGRLRQFHQMGVEVLGSQSPFVDVEVLDVLSHFLHEVGLEGALFKINSVGCPSCKAKYAGLLRDSLRTDLAELCGDCQRRFEKNVLRALDCKKESCQNTLRDIPLLPDVICQECKDHFNQVQNLLSQLNFPFQLAPKLIRGLDYYTRTIFEVTHSALGAQDALAAGGRYDQLVESMGGLSRGAFGFAMGVERMLLALEDQFKTREGSGKPFLFLASLGDHAAQLNFILQKDLRKNKILCEMDYDSKSFKSQLRRANKLGVRYVLLRGDDEIARNIIKLKSMEKGTEEEILIDQIIKVIEELYVTHTHLRRT